MKSYPHIKIFLILALTGGIICAPIKFHAQSYSEKFNGIYFEKINFENGLSNNVVKCIFQDHEGYIWFGTADGLDRYDGKAFKIFKNDPYNSHSVCGNIITGIAEDTKGLLWITTQNGGLCSYNRKLFSGFQFEQFRNDSKNKKSVPANDLNNLAIDRKDNIWVISENSGAFKLDAKTKAILYISNKEKDSMNENFSYGGEVIKRDDEGQLWCGLYGDLMMRINPEQHTLKHPRQFKTCDGKQLKRDVTIHSLLPLFNTLWFAHYSTLDKYDYKTGVYEQYPLMTDELSNKQGDKWVAMEKDMHGNIWIASLKNGCYVFDTTEKKFYNLRYDMLHPGSLASNTVNCLYMDKSGIMWIGTNNGICKYDPLVNQIKYNYINDAKNPSRENLNICDFYEENDGSFWLATDGGLFIRDKNALDFKCKYSDFHNQPLIIYKFLKDTNGKVYLITRGNNFIYNETKNRLIQIPFLDRYNNPNSYSYSYSYQISAKTAVVADTVYDIWYSDGIKRSPEISDFSGNRNDLQKDTVDRSASLWVGSIGWGLYRYNLSKNTCGISVKNGSVHGDCLSNNQVQAIIKDRNGKIWVATNGGGLNAMQYKSYIPSFVYFKNEPANPYSLSSNSISDMCLDKNGIFWITTYDGVLNRFDPDAKDKKHFTRITGTDDLSRQGMFSIVCDAKNNLWIATATAILKYNTSINKFSAWKLKDQLPYDQFPGKKHVGKDGTIYFGGNKFYISFKPDSLVTNTAIPQVVITSFKVFDKPADDLLLKNEIKLDYDKNFFSFEFSSLNFSNPSANKFAYKLDDIDKNWIQNGKKNSASYTGIPPGIYTFHVKASNNNDVWNEKGLSVKIIILPAWWQTLFFKIALLLVVLTIIFFATRYYFKQKLKLQQEKFETLKAVESVRSKISMDIHDEIGSQLTKISLMSQRIKLGFEKKKEIDPDLIDKITVSSKEVVGNLGEIIWTVNPKHDNLQSFLSYTRNYISNFFEHTAIECMLNFPEEIPAITIHPDLKHNLFLIIKESLNNIMKHAEASKVDVNFQYTNQTFCLEITDNGKGIGDMNGRDLGNGLMNMKKRMDTVNGRFEIISEKGTGTRITLKGKI